MIAVMGATGNTGKAVAERLLGAGKKIKAIGRSREKLRPFLERGAEAAAGDGMDPAFLASAFRGAEAVYAMVPADHPTMRAIIGVGILAQSCYLRLCAANRVSEQM